MIEYLSTNVDFCIMFPLDGIQVIVVTFARLIFEFYIGEQHKQVTL